MQDKTTHHLYCPWWNSYPPFSSNAGWSGIEPTSLCYTTKQTKCWHRYFSSSSVNVRYTAMSDGLHRDVRRWMRQAPCWLIDGKRRGWTLLNEVPDSSLPCTDGTAACVYFHPSGGLQTSTLLITLFWQGIKITENNLWVTDLTGMFATTQSYPFFSFFLSLSHREFIAPEYCEIY